MQLQVAERAQNVTQRTPRSIEAAGLHARAAHRRGCPRAVARRPGDRQAIRRPGTEGPAFPSTAAGVQESHRRRSPRGPATASPCCCRSTPSASSARRTPPAVASPPRSGRAGLRHTRGTDDRRGPVSAGRHRTRQDQHECAYRLLRGDRSGISSVPPVGLEPTLRPFRGEPACMTPGSSSCRRSSCRPRARRVLVRIGHSRRSACQSSAREHHPRWTAGFGSPQGAGGADRG